MPDPHPRPRPAGAAPAAVDIFHKILAGPTGPGDLDDFLRGFDKLTAGGLPARVNADPHNVERGLAQLVLTLIELLRQLMERQAVRRMEGGSLTDDEIERLGQTFMRLEQRMQQLKREFGLEDKDLNLDLGPLGKLL
jgi:Gas vesicle protein K